MAEFAKLITTINAAAGTDLVAGSSTGIAGGDINQAVRIFDRHNRAYFLKFNEFAFDHMFAAEFAGLAELSRAADIKIPQPIAHGTGGAFAWLLLEWLEMQPATQAAGEQLGRALAGMHQIQAKEFGWVRDNTIGRTPQLNAPCADWVEFLAVRRLGYQLQLAADNGADGKLLEPGERLLANLGAWFQDYSPVPSLLHGDLWGGNWGMLTDGRPALFDPAVYYGDREADIAMTRLFGGFESGFYRAYDEVWPLDAGCTYRQDLYNLYHVLNHYNLFGGHYLAQASRMLQSLVTRL